MSEWQNNAVDILQVAKQAQRTIDDSGSSKMVLTLLISTATASANANESAT